MRKIIFLTIFFSWIFGVDATINVVNSGTNLPRISVVDCSNLQNANLRNKFFKIIVGDLMVGSTFEVEKIYQAGEYNNNITSNNSDLVVKYLYDGALTLNIKVINGKNSNKIFEKIYNISDQNRYPFLAHNAISEIVKTIGFSNVDWMNKMIIFARENARKSSQILVSDYTLSYQKIIVNGGMNKYPKWTNKSQTEFYYTTFINSTPTLFKYNLTNGVRTRIISSNGMLVASDISEDGNRLVLTMAPNDQPDIYIFDKNSRNLTKVTNFDGIDVSGHFLDNETKIAFVSDRLGYPNIFSTQANSSSKAVNQMVYEGKNNSDLSTFKNYIVYSSRQGPGIFNLFLISTQSNYVRQLTASGKNLFPRFSDDGGSVLFIKYDERGSNLGIVRVNENKSFQFPLNLGQIQSLDW